MVLLRSLFFRQPPILNVVVKNLLILCTLIFIMSLVIAKKKISTILVKHFLWSVFEEIMIELNF